MAIVVIVAFFSVTLTTSAPLQNNTILNSSSDFLSSSAFQYVYAADDVVAEMMVAEMMVAEMMVAEMMVAEMMVAEMMVAETRRKRRKRR